jgi:tryptophan synthase beta chain
LETSHGIAYATKRAKEMSADQIIVVNLSGRGDKDVQEAARVLGEEV